MGWGSGARTEQRQKFLIPGLAKYEDLLSLAKFRTFSFHYPLSEPRVSRAKLKCRKGWNVPWKLTFVKLPWVLNSTLSEGQTQFGLHPEDQDGQSIHRHVTGEMTKELRMFTLEKRRLWMGEAENCLENSERPSCEKGIRYVICGPPKRP